MTAEEKAKAKKMTLYIKPELAKKLRLLAAELDTDQTSLINEAVATLLEKYADKIPISPSDR